MPGSRVPKLKLGQKFSRTKPTKALPGIRPIKQWSTGAKIVGGLSVLALITGVLFLILWIADAPPFKKRPRKHTSRKHTSYTRNRPMKNRASDKRKIDKKTDEEEHTVVPAPVVQSEDITLDAEHERQKKKETELVPPVSSEEKKPWQETTHFFESQFEPINKDAMDGQFKETSNGKPAKKVLSSKLGHDSVMPSFSVEKQPARQVGMSLDLAYTSLMDKDGIGEDGMRRPAQKMSEIPFGGSEFHDMVRSQQQGTW